MDSLPSDLRDDILFRLPIKNLLICTCVCKPWLSYIKHPRFIDAHLKRQRRDLLMIRTCPVDNEELYSLRVDDDDFSEYKTQKFPLIRSGGDHYRVVGSCNGVICVTDDQYMYRYATYLWNPSIRKCVVVPYPNVTYLTFGPYDQATGFGYDARTNDYKVVRILESYDDTEKPLEVELYSMSTGVWRNISHVAQNIRCSVRSLDERPRQAFMNGASHFLVENLQPGFVILVFHFGDEVLWCMDLPAAMTNDRFSIFWPTVLKGSLSLFQRAKNHLPWLNNNSTCCLWVMKEYGDSSSWTRQWNITIHPQIGRIFGFRNEGQFLVEIRENLYSFDPNKGSDLLDDSNRWLKELGLRSRIEDQEFSFHSENYTESLALLGAPMSVRHEELESLREELESRFRTLWDSTMEKCQQMMVAKENTD